MKKNTIILASACLAATVAAYPGLARAEDAAVPPVEQRPANSREQGEQRGEQRMDEHFVRMAANANLFEVAAAKTALDRVQRGEVKQFAQRVLDDHQKAQRALEAAAKAGKFEVPTQLDELHQMMLSHLEKMQGKHFERAYIYENVAAHMKCVLMFRDAAAELQDSGLKQFASATLPTLREHLQEAERLAGMGDDARTAGERIRASSDADDAAANRAKSAAGNRTGAAEGRTAEPPTPDSKQGTAGQTK